MQTYFKKVTPTKRKKITKAQEKKTLKKLTKKLDDVFSRWIRNRDSWKCITCDKYDPDSQWMHAGHYVLRRHMSVRWDERNVNAQCSGCNKWLFGNMDVYALRLQEKYGEGILKELNQLKQQTKQWKREELIELIKKYEG